MPAQPKRACVGLYDRDYMRAAPRETRRRYRPTLGLNEPVGGVFLAVVVSRVVAFALWKLGLTVTFRLER